jgi:uncharacterized peroxidase-related enzyme
MSFIHMVPETQATGQLHELYRRLSYQDGSVDEAYKSLSLNPALLAADAAMYEIAMYGPSPLSRAERELLALTVSRLNRCERCFRHHSARYAQLGGSDESGRAGGREGSRGRTGREAELLAFAEKLTREPGAIREDDVEQLRRAGLDDRAILDACNAIAYFNYANRMTLGLGLSPASTVSGVRGEDPAR